MLGFHWIVSNELAGSPQPGLYDDWTESIEFLRRNKIDFVMSLTEEPLIEDQIKAEGFGFFHFPIRDMDIPMPRPAVEALLFMKQQIKAGHKFLIHCKGGVGRTGLIGACYLVTQGMSAEQAVEEVRKVHPPYIQTKSQESFVGHFEELYRSRDELAE